jgi:hypothetical protein
VVNMLAGANTSFALRFTGAHSRTGRCERSLPVTCQAACAGSEPLDGIAQQRLGKGVGVGVRVRVRVRVQCSGFRIRVRGRGRVRVSVRVRVRGSLPS